MTTTPSPSARPIPWLRLLPVLAFLVMAGFFALALRGGDPSTLPSALIGKAAPQLALAPLDGLRRDDVPVSGVAPTMIGDGQPSVVNFWASWCAPCVAEHPLLVALARDTGIRLIGVNHKDTAANARRFLGRYGNPFAAVGVDGDGRAAIEWGVYGMPETFVIDGQGRIAYKHVGPITPQSLAEKIMPVVRRVQR